MKYNIKDREQHWQTYRSDQNIYAFDTTNNQKKPLYTIDTPPPTVSGKLHIGHVFSYTQAEIIARYKRMTWHNVYYPIGFDDNGIPTETLVYKELGEEARHIDRKTFRSKCLEVTVKYRDIYSSLRKSLGMSFDRTMSYHTISPFVQSIAQQRFIEIYKDGVIVRKKFPALRDRANQTTIAQAETEEIEKDAFFHRVRFDIVWGGELIIATTRPELMMACVAVFVHPEDERYADIIGKKALTPFWKEVPILSDDKVKQDKWSGAVMCCSYGDETDVYRIQKHKLEEIIVLDTHGRMINTWYEELEGLRTHQAREKILPILQEKWVLISSESIKQGILYSERSKAPVEIIPVTQRFINVLPIKKELLDSAQDMDFVPNHMLKRYEDRIENLQRDRNISRNRSFGISIPLRYSKKTWEIILPEANQYPVDPLSDLPNTLPENHTSEDIIGESMVLDTRFTSGLTPEINRVIMTNQGMSTAPEIFDLRPQAHDIIRTRLFYTAIHAYYAHRQHPFHHVMMSGHVLAKKWEKISKSKDNASFGPEQLLEQYGADAARYRSASWQLWRDIAFDESELKNGQKLITKLRNVYQFTKEHLTQDILLSQDDIQELYPTDRWILSRLDSTITKVTQAYEHYEVGLAKIAFEEFFWHDLCDNYLELIKQRLYQPELLEHGEQLRSSAQQTLSKIFWSIIRLLGPIMPHITEELYQDQLKELYGYSSIHIAPFPLTVWIEQNSPIKDTLTVVGEVRGYKTTQQLPLNAELQALHISWPEELLTTIKQYDIDLKGVTKAQSIVYDIQDHYSLIISP